MAAEGGEQDRPVDPAALVASLTGIAQGDRAAFRDLYDRVGGRLLGICLRITGDRMEAEDALQDGFVAIWRRSGSFDPQRGEAWPWLVTVVRHCAIDRLRARRPPAGEPLAFDTPDDEADAPTRIDQATAARRLRWCLDGLAATDRGLIEAAFFNGSTYSELAHRAGRPLGTIKSRIRRALANLAECVR